MSYRVTVMYTNDDGKTGSSVEELKIGNGQFNVNDVPFQFRLGGHTPKRNGVDRRTLIIKHTTEKNNIDERRKSFIQYKNHTIKMRKQDIDINKKKMKQLEICLGSTLVEKNGEYKVDPKIGEEFVFSRNIIIRHREEIRELEETKVIPATLYVETWATQKMSLNQTSREMSIEGSTYSFHFWKLSNIIEDPIVSEISQRDIECNLGSVGENDDYDYGYYMFDEY